VATAIASDIVIRCLVMPSDSPCACQPAITRLAFSKSEAAQALGVSVDFLEKHVMHELRIVRRGRRRLIPVRELERWLDANAGLALGDARG
jgi:excisionase family DNA binding protein